VRFLPSFSPLLSRILRVAIVVAWILQMGVLFRSVAAQGRVSLAADLAQYGGGAHWYGVYYRGEKIGFTVEQTRDTADGYDLEQDGRLQMTLLGATTAAKLRTIAHVDRAFGLKTFSFSLDPGTGPVEISGSLEGRSLKLTITTPSGTRKETRQLAEAPALSLNLPRRLAAEGLAPGKHLELNVFDPATLRNAPMTIDVRKREVVDVAGRPVPTFRVESRYSGITSTSFVTDVGEVVREESPSGLFTVRETRERALAVAVPGSVQSDLLEGAAVVPQSGPPIPDPASVDLARFELSGAELPQEDLEGVGQSLRGDVLELRTLRDAPMGPPDPGARRYLGPEAFIESDAPEIQAEAEKALKGGPSDPRGRAERLARYVNALIEKKPTASLPSALEVLRTKVGDCNEHATLYVALARAAGIPARLVVGLVYLHGAFYYHAWNEVYVESAKGGLWLSVDPTLNQFPADATHIRFARGGLDRQAVLMGLLGRLKIRILNVQNRPGTTPILVGRPSEDMAPPDLPLPRREGSGRACLFRTGAQP
jgi:transglutaminase-like putative cysteine protease